MNKALLPTTEDELASATGVLRPVRRYCRMYAALLIVLVALICLAVYGSIFFYRQEKSLPLGLMAIIALFLLLLPAVYRFTGLYFRHYQALKKDLTRKHKRVISGITTGAGHSVNSLVYQLDGSDYAVTNRLLLLGWKIDAFQVILHEEVTLHYLPESKLLLKVVYKNIPAVSTRIQPLSAQQIAAYRAVTTRNVPGRQQVNEGIVTETLTASFKINARLGTSTTRVIRLGDLEFQGVTDKLELGRNNIIRQFMP